MDISDKIQKLLTQHNRNIIFYFDDDGSFKDELPDIEQSGIKVVHVAKNYFALKHFFEFQASDEKMLVYHPFPKPTGKDLKKYPLLDLLIANVELRLDDASEFLAEYHLQEHHLPLVKRYIKQLKTKTNKKKLAPILTRTHFSEDSLKWGLISVALDFNTVATRNQCVAKWLSLATDNAAFDKANKSIANLDLQDPFVTYIGNLFDIGSKTLDRDFAREVACKIKYNILTIYVDQPHKYDSYKGFKMDAVASLNKLQAFFNEWDAHPLLRRNIEPVFDVLAADIKTSNILSWYGAGSEYGYYSGEMIEGILRDLYREAVTNPLKTKENSLKWLKNESLSDDNRHQFLFVYHATSLFTLLKSYSSFKFNTLEDYIREYTSELYQIDTHFRKAVTSYESISDHLYELAEDASSVFVTLNQKYDTAVKTLNVEWQKLLEEKKFDYQRIPVAKQYDFYRKNLKEFDYKMVVIISDALRYELGKELFDDLLPDGKNTVNIEPYLASIPSYTNLGMANLLPHDQISLEKGDTDLVLKINGTTTSSSNRRKILQQVEPGSDTISFGDAMKLNQDAGRKFFSDNRIVYVYHDWIDAIGDKKKTEYQTFEATTKALEDIKRLIKMLNAWNVYHVMVTADHGFLFNHTKLTEVNREKSPPAKGYCRENTRFVVADDFEGKVDGYVVELSKTTNVDTDLKVALPRAVNRYRKQGNIGLQFTHGGASLQELLIPVVKVYRQKKELGEAVSFKRIDENKKITTGSIKITLLQDQPVSNQHKSREIILGLYSDTGELYAKEVTLHLNSTSSSPKDRIFEPILTLNNKGSKASHCYLKAFDINDKNRLNPLGIDDILQISAMMEMDF